MLKKINIKELIKGIIVMLSYFILPSILSIPLVFLYKKYIINYPAYVLLLYISLAIIYILIYLKDLIKDFKVFKKDYKSILKISFSYWLKGLFIMYCASILISFLNIETNTNQEANIELFKSMPIVEIVTAIICAPIIEELVFRKSLRKGIPNKNIYAILTGLIFAAIHITSSLDGFNNLYMLIYFIPYGALGIAFGYAYAKTDNIFSTMVVHAFHNTLSLIMIALGALL